MSGIELKWKSNPPAKKPRLIDTNYLGEKEREEKAERERILIVENSRIHTDRIVEEVKPLVIPLLSQKQPILKETIESTGRDSSKPVTDSTDSLTKQAEEELLRELNADQDENQGKKSSLIIKSEEQLNSQNDSQAQKSLLQALIERQRLAQQQGEDKLGLDDMADDIDFKSEVFEAVPVEQFGAALLRGMGWDGQKSDAEKKLEQRQKRLGLGAAPLLGPNKNGAKQPTANTAASNLPYVARESGNKIVDKALVRIEDPKFLGLRGKVLQARGVPGLNMVRIELEQTGEVVDISRKYVQILSAEELEAKAFVPPPKKDKVDGKEEEVVEYDPLTDFSVVKRSQTQEGMVGDDHMKQESKEGKHKQRQSIEKDKHKDSTKGKDNRPTSSYKSWLRSGLRVKIVSKSLSSDSYLQKATILDVYSLGVCSVKLDSTGKVLEGVKEKYLETVIPSRGGMCMVLTGEYIGEVGRLIDRDDKTQQVTIELVDSLDMVIMSMDDISAINS